MQDVSAKIKGVILGTAVGDAVGLPREGLSPARARRLFGDRPLSHAFCFRKGLCSDDTEHTCMTAQALIAGGGNVAVFERTLAWKFRLWLLGAPAGVGLATLKSICRLWLGFSPATSGVCSAGNGPAMRSAVIGVYAKDDRDLLQALVRASTRITHTDPRAEQGALAIALAAGYAADRTPAQIDPGELAALLAQYVTQPELSGAIETAFAALKQNLSLQDYAETAGFSNGVSGYIVHTVPAVLFCWLKNTGSFRAAVEEVIVLGGDTDTTGAITGALAGAAAGVDAIPKDWIDGLGEWPRTPTWLAALADTLADAMADKTRTRQLPLCWPALIPRNAGFTAAVLSHALRRLLPPY